MQRRQFFRAAGAATLAAGFASPPAYGVDPSHKLEFPEG